MCGRERSSLELCPPPARAPGWTPRTMRRPTDLYGSERDDRGRRCPPLKIRELYCDTPSRHGCCQPWHPNFCHPHAVVVGAGAGPWCIARKESGRLPVVAAASNGRRRWLECTRNWVPARFRKNTSSDDSLDDRGTLWSDKSASLSLSLSLSLSRMS